MDRKEAVLRIKNHMEHHGIGKYPHLKLKEALDMAIAALSQPNEWVSVEERLPEESDGMVLFMNGRAVTSGYRNHMFRMSDEEGVYAPAIRKGGGYMRVTHWMHLPAPPDRRPPEKEKL